MERKQSNREVCSYRGITVLIATFFIKVVSDGFVEGAVPALYVEFNKKFHSSKQATATIKAVLDGTGYILAGKIVGHCNSFNIITLRDQE